MMALSSLGGASNLNLMLFRSVLSVELVLEVLPLRRKLPRIGLCKSFGEDGVGEEVVERRCCGAYVQLGLLLLETGLGEKGNSTGGGTDAAALMLSEWKFVLALKMCKVYPFNKKYFEGYQTYTQ